MAATHLCAIPCRRHNGLADQEAMVVGNTRLTYRRFWDDVRRTAANLKQLGLRRGDHFAICLGNSTEWATLLFAAATIGAVTVPVNTRFKADELLYCLKQADVRMLAIADRFLKIDFIAMLRSICPALYRQLPDPGLPLLRTVIVFGGDVPAGALPASELNRDAAQRPDEHSEEVIPDDLLLIRFTFRNHVVSERRAADPYQYAARTAFSPVAAWGSGSPTGFTPRGRFSMSRAATLSVLASLQHVATLVTMDREFRGRRSAAADGSGALHALLRQRYDVR